MLEDLKIPAIYDGFLFLAESVLNPPVLKPHHHVELELNLVARGEITYVVGERRYTFPQRSLLWMFPAQEHQLVNRTPDAAYYVAVFKPTMIRQACRETRYQALKRKRNPGDGVLSTKLDPETFDLVRNTMDALVVDGLDPDILNREAGFGVNSSFTYEHHDPDWLNAGLRHLLLQCWRQQQGRQGGHGDVALHPAVTKALERIGLGDDEEDLSFLAKRCGLSPSHLSRLFSQQVGVSLSHYRNSVRLGRFWHNYHRLGKGSILASALEAGFGSYAQFYRVYKSAYGVGPRESMN